MRGVVAALGAIAFAAIVGCSGSSNRHERGGHGGSAGAGDGSAGARDSVDCGSHRPCGVDFPCFDGSECLSLQGCVSSVCGSADELCAEGCGSAGCVTVEAANASPPILECADGSRPRTAEPIEGFGDSCLALPDELERIERCTTDADCGQILETFPLCSSLPGPGRPAVVRNDADLTELNRLLTVFSADGCPAVRNACSCSLADDTFGCVAAHCAWTSAHSCATDE